MTNLDPNALMENQTCPAIGYQSASICVPVTVTPYAQTGVTTTKCCGTPVVTPGIAVCGGIKNGSCAFTITQDICVAVPVEFGAVATVGDSFVSSITGRDYMVIMGTTIFLATLIITMNVIVDIVYKIIDPRIKLK